MKRLLAVAHVIIFTLSFSGNIFAETKSSDDEWQFTLAPLFLWGVSIDGTSQVGPTTAPLNLDFKDDVFENLSAVFTIHFEAQKSDWTLFAEYQYLELDPSVETPVGPVAEINFPAQIGEFGVAYNIATYGINDFQVLAGARYTRQDLEVSFSPGPQRLIDVSETWWDGFIGLRVFTHISDNWTFVGRGDIGAGGSDFVWNLMAMFDYQIKDWISVFFGYKWLDYDYDNEKSGFDRYAYDATQQGPLAGLAFYW